MLMAPIRVDDAGTAIPFRNMSYKVNIICCSTNSRQKPPEGGFSIQTDRTLVAWSVRIVSAAWRVITSVSSIGSSADGSSTDSSGAYRHSRTYTTIVATAIYTTVINANSSSIIRGGVS
jgi:hypothetical protein